MSPNVDVLRAGVDAVNRRNAEALVATCEPDVEFRAYFNQVSGGVFEGHAGMRAYLREVTETFAEFVIQMEQAESRGHELVVAHMTAHGRGVSGVDVEWQAVIAIRFRDGRAWRMASHPTEREALEAVGLRE